MEELIIKERDTREKLVELVNNSQLPAILLKPMFKEMLEQLNIIEENQYIQAKELKENTERKEDKENGKD